MSNTFCFIGKMSSRGFPRGSLGDVVAIACLTGVLLLLGSGCKRNDDSWRSFDGPIDVAITMPNEIIDVPVGFVSNYRSGKIVKIDLLHNIPLSDRPEGSWVRSMPLATGRDRMLEQIAVTSYYSDPSNYYMTVFASDGLRDSLLMIPYLDSLAYWGPACIPEAPSCKPGEPVGDKVCGPETGFVPRYPVCIAELETQLDDDQEMREGTIQVLGPDGKPTGFTLREFWLREGKTSTQTWTGTYDVTLGRFVVVGSRAGVQERVPAIGETYWTDDNEVELMIVAPEGKDAPPDSSTFTFNTDSGLEEFPVPGAIQDLVISEAQDLLFATVQGVEELLEGTIVRGYLVVMDLAPLKDRESPRVLIESPLCPEALAGDGVCQVDSKPMAMDLDETHARLFVSDASDSGVLYQVDLTTDPPSIDALPGFMPNLDVAYVEDLESEDGYQHLFVANEDNGTITFYDVKAGRIMDVNPFTPEVDPIRLFSPVRGLAGSLVSVLTEEATDEQITRRSILLGATTYKGDLFAIKGEDGCQMFASPVGAYVSSEGWSFSDAGSESNPVLISDSETGKMAVLSDCGGITQSETWQFAYDELLQGYKVRGSRTNEIGEYQRSIAYEDERYTSDGGEISVLIRAGTLPTTDGDAFYFTTVGNVYPVNVGELPDDFVTYTQGYGDWDSDWTDVSFRTWALVPSALSDVVFKVDLGEPNISNKVTVVSYR